MIEIYDLFILLGNFVFCVFKYSVITNNLFGGYLIQLYFDAGKSNILGENADLLI